MRIKKWDFVLFLIPVLIAVISFSALFSSGSTQNIAVIILNGNTVKTIDLDTAKDQIIDLNLKYNNIIEIKNNKIGIIKADCHDKICVKTGFIGTAGQITVCVPSKLIIKITGKPEYDVISGMVGGVYE